LGLEIFLGFMVFFGKLRLFSSHLPLGCNSSLIPFYFARFYLYFISYVLFFHVAEKLKLEVYFLGLFRVYFI